MEEIKGTEGLRGEGWMHDSAFSVWQATWIPSKGAARQLTSWLQTFDCSWRGLWEDQLRERNLVLFPRPRYLETPRVSSAYSRKLLEYFFYHKRNTTEDCWTAIYVFGSALRDRHKQVPENFANELINLYFDANLHEKISETKFKYVYPYLTNEKFSTLSAFS